MTANPILELPKTQQPLLKLLGQEAAQLGYIAYVVGGFVRDSVLNTQTHFLDTDFLDIDIVLDSDDQHSGVQHSGVQHSGVQHNDTSDQPEPELPAIRFARHLQEKFGGHIITHSAFGTAKWITDDPASAVALPPDLSSHTTPSEIDLVTARDEIYTDPAALPTITPSNLSADLRRRDISTNTLAVCLAPTAWQQLTDQHSGISDIQAKRIRVLHDQSFVDDPTRIFRAIRYEQRFDFNIEPHTLVLLRAALPHIQKLSPVRIRHELDRTLAEDTIPELILQRMDQLDVLAAIHPALQINTKIEQSFAQLRTTLTQPPPHAQDSVRKILAAKPIKDLYWSLWLASLPPKTSSEIAHRIEIAHRLEIAQRVELSKETIQTTHDLYTLNQPTTWPTPQQGMATPNRGQLSPSQVVAAISPFDPLAIALFATSALAANQKMRQTETGQYHQAYATKYLNKWMHIKPILTGDDLRELGIPPGPQYRHLLTALRNQRLDGNLTDRASEIAYVQTLTAE